MNINSIFISFVFIGSKPLYINISQNLHIKLCPTLKILVTPYKSKLRLKWNSIFGKSTKEKELHGLGALKHIVLRDKRFRSYSPTVYAY